ncbi:MAG: enoyl-CoA hydratase-related protein [Minwuia sp.]|uniref:enoyl-CoA hydratase-related protein n=1 Tax=Minwuia sp. TaxID=2493630 RepID=UPI003A83F73D
MDLLPESFETILLERPEPHVLVVKFNRPEARNAMNTQMGADMKMVWEQMYVDPGDTRCIILTGTGDKAFCAGGDLKQRNNMTDEQWQQQHALFERGMMAMMDCPVPVIAAVNGAAFGGGCEFVCGADFAYASTTARFALTETSLGIMPGAMGTQNLPRAVGVRRAKEIILTATPFGAQEAFDWGLVNKVCEPDELIPAALETARKIASNGPIAVRQAKKSVSMSTQLGYHTGYLYEIEAYNRMVPTEDRLEGVRAFNEKRKADFKGR